MFTKHHVTTSEGHRVIARKQGYGWSPKVTIALKNGTNLPRYGGVEMSRAEAQRLVTAINEAIEAVE